MKIYIKGSLMLDECALPQISWFHGGNI